MLNYLKSSFKDSVIYGLGSIAVKLSGLILIPLYTHYFSITEYGLLGFLEATSAIIVAIFSFSLYQAFFIWYWDPLYVNRQKSLFFNSFSSLFLIVLFLFLVTVVFSKWLTLTLFGDIRYEKLFLFMITASGLQIISTIPMKLLQLQQKAFLYTSANILMLAVNLFFIVFFIVYMKYGIESIYIAQTIGGVVFLFILSPFIIKNTAFNYDTRLMLKMMLFVLPLIISSIATLIISVSDRYILRFISGYANLGLYSFGAKLANTINVILAGPLQLAIQPILVKIYNTGTPQRFYSKIMTYLSFLLILAVLFISLFGQEIVKVLAQKKEYWDAFKVIPILAFASLFMMMKDLASLHLQIMKKTKLLSMIIISVSLLNIGLNLLLIPLFSYIGAALSFLISQIIYFILLHYFANKPFRIGYEYRKIFLITGIAVILIFTGFLFSKSSLIMRLSVKIPLLLVFPFILYYFKFFEEIELQRIADIWKTWRNPNKWKQNMDRLRNKEDLTGF